MAAQPRQSIRRILFVDHTAIWGGGEVALFHLVRNLDPSRYQPIVLLFSDGSLAGKLRAAGIETHVIDLSASVINARKGDLGGKTLLRLKDVRAALNLVAQLRQFMLRHHIDLVHTNSLKSDIIGGAAARAARLPLIWHVRDRIDDDYLPGKVASVFRWLSRIVPTRVIAISNAVRQTLLPNSRVVVVHDGTPLPAAPSSHEDGAAPLVGLVGRIAPWKGQDVFLRAAALVHDRMPLARFQIIGAPLFGEQEYEGQLRESVAREGLDDVVEFTGFRDNAAELIGNLDLLVHASTTGEPFGQVVIEGMAAGKPVIATRGGAIPEIVQDARTGFIVPMGDAPAMADAIVNVLSDPDRARAMGAAGRVRVAERFTIAHTAAGVQEVYDQVLARSSAS